MPAVAAHYFFGKEVVPRLSEHIKRQITPYQTAFDLGLQGPDILFYYAPLSKNKVSNYGHAIHSRKAGVFFRSAADCIHARPNPLAVAYIYGFLCHYILDTECHPQIQKVVNTTSIGHVELETALDWKLLQNRGEIPSRFKRYETIVYTTEIAKSIAPFYLEVSTADVDKSIRSMRFYNHLLYSPSGAKIALFRLGESLIGKPGAFSALAITPKQNEKCIPFVGEIIQLYTASVDIAVENLTTFHSALYHGAEIKERLDRTFV